MKKPILATLALAAAAGAAALCAAPRPVQAAPYWPWCSRYFDKSNAEACAFSSWEQCMQTISGIGGFCYTNPYPPPAPPAAPGRTHRGTTRG